MDSLYPPSLFACVLFFLFLYFLPCFLHSFFFYPLLSESARGNLRAALPGLLLEIESVTHRIVSIAEICFCYVLSCLVDRYRRERGEFEWGSAGIIEENEDTVVPLCRVAAVVRAS